MKMAFQSLFKKLCPAEEGVRNPGQTASARMRETENCIRPNVPKRDNQEERQPPRKRRREQAETRAADGVGLEPRIRQPDQHAGISNRRGVWCHRGNRGQNDHTGHKHQTFQHKNNNSWKNRMQEHGKPNQRGRGRHTPRGGGHESTRRGGRGRRDHTEEVKVKPRRLMTQEFQEQNALLLDGRLLCRHFLWGRCIKGDDCQLEHIQSCNDLIKQLCKFYVQGCCIKGKDCPYMHQSFPCKYFHKKGYCSQGADCRFSHEPLNDVTSKLFDEVMKCDEIRQLAEKAEEESSEQAKQLVSSETESSPGVTLAPLRPNFYQSANTNVESDVSGGQADVQQPAADVQPAAGEASQPVGPPSSPRQPSEPVCYSVEAVLGPQRFRSFTGLLPASGQKEFQPLRSAESLPAGQSRVPYAGVAGLGARKATEEPVLDQRFSPEPHLKARPPPPSPDPVRETVSCWNGPQENRLRPGLHVGLGSRHCWNLPLTSAKPWKPAEKTKASQLSPQASHEATFEDRCSVNSIVDSGPRSGPTKSCDSADPGSLNLKVREPSKSQRELTPGSEEQCSATNPAQCSAASADLGRPFRCLFAAPLCKSAELPHQPTLSHSSPASQSADGRNTELGSAPSSFLSLFAAPLGTAPFLPQSPQRKRRGQTETVPSRAEPAEAQPASQNLLPGPGRHLGEETRGAEGAQPGGASPAERPASSSLLKTLFGSLKPYRQQGDEEHAQMLQVSKGSSRFGFGGF